MKNAKNSKERSRQMPTAGFETVSSAVGAANNYTRWVIQTCLGCAPSGNLLEVGVGHANYRPLLGGSLTYTGTDIDSDILKKAQARWPNDRFIRADMCDPVFPDLLGRSSFDHVLCINTLQYAKDERTALENMVAVLRPGGRFAILLPAMKLLYGKMDVLAGHRKRYSRADLKAMGDGLPINDQRIAYFNPVGALGWFANNLMRPDDLNEPSLAGQVAFFNKFVLPMSRVIDPITRAFFGQSLIWTGARG